VQARFPAPEGFLRDIGIPLGREVGAQMVLIVILATIPGLRSAFQVDLGQVSKGQSV
jgi:hypothetical protein